LRDGVIVVGVPVTNGLLDYLLWLKAVTDAESESRPAVGCAIAELLEDAMKHDEIFARRIR
jgi:hypothetical protein